MNHPMHLHNHRFQVISGTADDSEAARNYQDITDVPPAQRHTIEFEADADPGIYLMHCHKVSHAMNGTSYPGGMVGGIVSKEAMDTDIFRSLMDYAGYEGGNRSGFGRVDDSRLTTRRLGCFRRRQRTATA